MINNYAYLLSKIKFGDPLDRNKSEEYDRIENFKRGQKLKYRYM